MAANKDILILSLETSADGCSASLSVNGKSVADCSIEEPRKQTSRLAPMVEELLGTAGCGVKDCAAVAVSSGPGSYTGLRVGVSMAKGLCFGAGIPLIGVNTLDLIAVQGRALLAAEPLDYIVPMIDARRMEVYQAVYDADCVRIGKIEPLILDETSYADLLAKGRVLFCGDGCDKFQAATSSVNALFAPFRPDSRYMAKLAFDKYLTGDFEDVAYMEPFYLKDFRIGQSKKNILGI